MKRIKLLNGHLLILFVSSSLLATASCTSAPSTTPTPAPAPSLAPAPTPTSILAPSIKITLPTGNVPAGSVTVTVVVSGFILVDELGKPNIPGRGHIHYFLDANPPTAPGKAAVTAAGTYYSTALTSYTWPDVTPGSHKLSVELVNNDHTPLEPPVLSEVTVTVTAAIK